MALREDLRGRIVAHRNDRMGGRLIAILNAIRISRDYGIPFAIAWVSHERTAAELRDPTDIFSCEFVERHFISGDLSSEDWAALDDLDGTVLRDAEALQMAATGGAGFLSQRSVGATVLPWEEQDQVTARLAACFDGIEFCDTIRRVSAQIDARLSGTHLFAYHIRRGDIISTPITSQKLWPNKYIPREFYETHLRRQLADPAAACLVLSDTPYEVERLKALDRRVLSFEDLVCGEELLAGQRDFLELFAMSRCKTIYGPPHSAFSQTAATLGGGTVLAVEEALDPREHAQAIELLISRMDAPEEHFLGDGDLGQSFPFIVEHLRRRGEAARGRNLLAAQVNRGFSKPYVYPALCELSVDCDDLQGCRKVLDAAWQRPVSGDEALGRVAAHAAMACIGAGATKEAHRWALVAWWFGPMDRMVPGVLTALLSAGWIDVAPSYPLDPRMIHRKGKAFPGGDPHLSRLNETCPPDGWAGQGLVSYPWEIALRDWRQVHGKRVGRGYWNRTRIRNGLDRFEKNNARLAGTPELESAAAVMLRELGELETARERNATALKAHPDEALYLKRAADISLESGRAADGIRYLEAAVEMSGRHPAYVAALGQCYGQARRSDEMAALFKEISASKHDLIEILMMTADVLRRQDATRPAALEQIERAVRLGHGSHRLLTVKARILAEIGRMKEAEALFLSMARGGLAQPATFAHMYRLFEKAGDLATVKTVVAESPYRLEEIRALVQR